MMNFTSAKHIAFAIVIIGLCCCGCSNPFQPTPAAPRPPDAAAAAKEKDNSPPLGSCTPLEAGICRHEITLQRDGVPMKVWIYLPGGAAEKLPCVLIGAAGSHLIDGMKLAKEDQDEHLPWARAGFAVVAYEIDGAWPNNNPGKEDVVTAALAFKRARAGVANAAAALDFALAKVPAIDSQRIYAVGHSSAATLALLVASSDPRIKACVAFAPAADAVKRVGVITIRQLESKLPGFADFMKSSSPVNRIPDLHCPLFLFHAKDDDVVPVGESQLFKANLTTAKVKLTYEEVPTGGHHDG